MDTSAFITQAPPQGNGLQMTNDVLKSIAERRQQMAIAKMQDDQRREAERLMAEARANALRETTSHNLSTEEQARGVLGETGRHNQSTEQNARDSLTQQRAAALSKLLAMPGTQTALQATDPGQLDAMAPALKALGGQVQAPQPGPDDVLPMTGEEPQQRNITGADGAPLISFDPGMNAVTRGRRAMQAREQAERAAQGMNHYDAAGMQAGGGMAAALAEAGADPLKALEGGQKYATSSSGQATSRTNASQMAAARKEGGARNEPYKKNAAVENFVKSIESQNKLPELRQKIADAGQMLDRLRNPTGIGDTVSMAQLGRSLFGAAQSNAEGNRLLNAGGLGTRLKNAISKMDNGQFAPEFRKDLETLAKSQEMAYRTRIARAGSQAQRLARQHGIIGKIKGADEYVRGRITGQIGGDQVDFGDASSGSSGSSVQLGGEPAANADVDSLMELLKPEE